MDIKSGSAESHPTPLPLDASKLPGVQAPTPRFPGADSPANADSQVSGTRDCTGERLEQLAAAEAAASAAMTEGMAADGARRQHYAAAMSPLGAGATDEMALPAVPEQATAPSDGFLYGQGDQPGA